MATFQSLPGFREFYPDDLSRRKHIFDLWRRTAHAFGFAEYDAPVLEPLELYKAKSGDEIEAQLFSFTDKGGREVALRPEMRLKRWRDFFRQMPTPYFFYAPDDYKKWLPKFGFKIHALKLAPKDATYGGAEGFATWLRTTWIPYIQRVPENGREEFIAAVTQRYVAKHPPDDDGKIHVRMVRLEIAAEKV